MASRGFGGCKKAFLPCPSIQRDGSALMSLGFFGFISQLYVRTPITKEVIGGAK